MIIRGEVAAKKPGEIITNYQLPEITYHSSTIDEQMEYNKYLYTPCYLWKERSKPEIMFENDINQHQAIKWWWKNGEKKKEYFGIKYQYQNNIHTFYPDYVLMTMNNTVIMAEVKDSKDREGSTYTKAKAEAMQEFLRDYPGVIGGICIFRNGRWFINNKSSYEWDDTINDDWSDWEEFDQLL